MLPKIAKELKTSDGELGVYMDSILPSSYATAFHRMERVVKEMTTFCDPMFVTRRRHHEKSTVADHFYGCRIYETVPHAPTKIHKPEKPIRFAVIRLSTDTRLFLIAKKSDVVLLYRHGCRYVPSRPMEVKAPIMRPEILKTVLDETIGFLELLQKHKDLELRASRGVMLHGPPGNGKTMLCRWLVNEAAKRNWSHGLVTASQIRAAFGQDRLTELFCSKKLIICDDIDVEFFSRRGKDCELACALLASLDGVRKQEQTVRIFTSNESVETMDDAFKRPGRIDRAIEIPLPNREMRLTFIKTWNTKLLEALDPYEILEACGDMSFAELDEVQRNLLVNWIRTKKFELKKAVDDMRNRLNDLPVNLRNSVGFGGSAGDDE